jgi:hypothetical protein
MSSPDKQSSASQRIDWRGVARVALLQILVLLALAGGFIRYLNWSSEAAWAEFLAASKAAASDPKPASRSATGLGPQSPTASLQLRRT